MIVPVQCLVMISVISCMSTIMGGAVLSANFGHFGIQKMIILNKRNMKINFQKTRVWTATNRKTHLRNQVNTTPTFTCKTQKQSKFTLHEGRSLLNHSSCHSHHSTLYRLHPPACLSQWMRSWNVTCRCSGACLSETSVNVALSYLLSAFSIFTLLLIILHYRLRYDESQYRCPHKLKRRPTPWWERWIIITLISTVVSIS